MKPNIEINNKCKFKLYPNKKIKYINIYFYIQNLLTNINYNQLSK